MLSTVAGTMSAAYLADAENILGALGGYFDTAPNGLAVLLDGYPGGLTSSNTALIFGDYYFTEALLRLQNVLDGEPGWVLYSPALRAVPETSTWAMMLIGFAGLGLAGYRTLRKAAPIAPDRAPA